jgi:hypothetical protein
MPSIYFAKLPCNEYNCERTRCTQRDVRTMTANIIVVFVDVLFCEICFEIIGFLSSRFQLNWNNFASSTHETTEAVQLTSS